MKAPVKLTLSTRACAGCPVNRGSERHESVETLFTRVDQRRI